MCIASWPERGQDAEHGIAAEWNVGAVQTVEVAAAYAEIGLLADTDLPIMALILSSMCCLGLNRHIRQLSRNQSDAA